MSNYQDASRALKHDSHARVVILTGAGKGFCSGHDLRSAGKPNWVDDPEMGRMYYGRHAIAEINALAAADAAAAAADHLCC